jgi:hypothetical protein
MLVSLLTSPLKLVGSLLLTVVILFLLIAILLWGTVVEKYYGATAAKFGIYGSWWFNTLGLILALNSAAALVLRWPWKLPQLGFILPHLGLIVLLVGCYLSRCFGIEATLSVFEGESSNLAYKGSNQHVELDGQQHFSLQVIPTGDLVKGDAEKGGETIVVPFTSGPFNWEDFHNGALNYIPWSLAHRDQGVLYDRGGIRLEVLDYLSNSEIVNRPCLAVHATPLGPDGQELPEQSSISRFEVKADMGQHAADHPYGIGNEKTLAAGQRVLFWMTGSPEETEAFLHSKPSGPLGKLGRVVLWARGKAYDLPLSDWTKGTRRPLGDSGMEAEFVEFGVEQVPVAETVVLDPRILLTIHHGSSSHPLILSAEFPEIFSQQDYADKVFGTLWPGQPGKPDGDVKPTGDAKPAAGAKLVNDDKPTDYPKPPADPQAKAGDAPANASSKAAAKSDAKSDANAAAKPDSEPKQPEGPAAFGPPRVDFFQGADQELYFRSWRAGRVRIVGPLKMSDEGGRITAFAGDPDAVVLRFRDFQPAERPDYSARPLPYDKSDEQPHLRQAYVRLTVDDQSREFWIPCSSPDPIEQKVWSIPKKLQRKSIAGKGRHVELSFAPESFEIGYTVHLNHAWRKLDPGTRQPSFFGSEIDLLPNDALIKSSSAASPGKQYPKYEKLLVTLNAPLDIIDPAMPGRSYRMFQSSMPGPFNPEEFDRKPGESVYLSGFTLNYDPGRGLTYVGCLLIVAGIFVAYFVRFAIPSRRSSRVAAAGKGS